jgi:glycerol-3-phosphate dehydrogenase
VALVDKADFAWGTSSRSSRLVHGGVRYLEHGHIHLVFESSAERRALLRLAPHLGTATRIHLAVYEGARISRWKLGAGLFAYDAPLALRAMWRGIVAFRATRFSGESRRSSRRDFKAARPTSTPRPMTRDWTLANAIGARSSARWSSIMPASPG